MQVLCSADWHISLNRKNIPNDWAVNRYRSFFTKICKLEVNVDRHFIMGDVFEKLPSMQELELYFEFVSICSIPTYIIPGNHESVRKNTTFLTHLKDVTNKINRNVLIIDDYFQLENIDFIPYNRLKEFNPDNFNNPILVTHCRGNIPPHVKSEVPIEHFSKWKVVLLGDLHSYENCQENLIYPGSPMTITFHRTKVKNGVIIFNSETLEHQFIDLELPQLIRKTIQAGDQMPATHPDHTIYEVEGDMSQLANIEDSELMDKKVVKRSTDTSLILSPEMSIEEEVAEYLAYILELPQETIDKAMKEFHDNFKNTSLE